MPFAAGHFERGIQHQCIAQLRRRSGLRRIAHLAAQPAGQPRRLAQRRLQRNKLDSGQLGFAVDEARVGRVIDLELNGADADAARAELERACEQLLANPLIESYEIAVERSSAAARTDFRGRCSAS